MAMTPGGENPDNLSFDSRRHRFGIRVQKRAPAFKIISHYRQRFFRYETDEVLGRRSRPTVSRSAFGARNFQPHILFIRNPTNVSLDLKEVGESFRDKVDNLVFDRFQISSRTFVE
jgi:hypothetical protein